MHEICTCSAMLISALESLSALVLHALQYLL